MKKSMKYFLFGVGTVFAGVAAYIFLKESKDDCEAKSDKKDDVTDSSHTVSHTDRNTVTLNKQYVERRRELARKRAAERAAATVTSTLTAEPDKTDGITDRYLEPVIDDSLKNEEIEEATQEDNILLIKTKQAEEGEADKDERE